MLTKLSMHQYNMKFIEKPNLPQSRVVVAAISESATQAIEYLNKSGVKTLLIPASPYLPKPVNSHADLQILHTGNNNLFSQKEHLFRGYEQEKFNIHYIKESAGNSYPYDVRLNCALIGDKLICNRKTISREILEYAEINNINVINVNQGYTKCSICIVNEKTIITDDESIYTAAGNFFNDTLYVSKNSIVLKGYDYGFIGGCCGKIDKDVMAFNGRIESHSDHNKIIDFFAKHNIKIIELSTERLTDIGGILPLCEI